MFWEGLSKEARKRSGPWKADILAGKTNEEPRKHISQETTSRAKHGRKERLRQERGGECGPCNRMVRLTAGSFRVVPELQGGMSREDGREHPREEQKLVPRPCEGRELQHAQGAGGGCSG